MQIRHVDTLTHIHTPDLESMAQKGRKKVQMFPSKKGGEIRPEHGWNKPSPDWQVLLLGPWFTSPGQSGSLPLSAARGKGVDMGTRGDVFFLPLFTSILFCLCHGVEKRFGRLGSWSAEHQGTCQRT